MKKEDILSDLGFFSDEQLAKLIVKGNIMEDDLNSHPDMADRWSNVEAVLNELRPKPKPLPIEREAILNDLDFYTDEQLVIFIQRGNLTKIDLKNTHRWPQVASLLDNQSSKKEGTKKQDSTEELKNEEPKKDENPSVEPEVEIRNVQTLKIEIKNIWADKDKSDKVGESYKVIRIYLKEGFCTKDDLLDEVRRDHNWLGSDVVAAMLRDHVVSESDLKDIGIHPDFISMLKKPKHRVPFPSHVMPEPIVNDATEIYFWGMPSSGKTCALCSILGTLKNGNVISYMNPDPSCSGFGYISMATDMFKASQSQSGENGQSVTLLPLGTSERAFYELAMQVVDKEGLRHPITCIDMAGETIRSMYKSNANLPLEGYQVDVLQSLNDILTKNHKPGNRMIHVFVVEYGAENRRYEGLDQITLLESAANYLTNLKLQKKKLFRTVQYGIFEEDADGIYIMVTKADKMNAQGNDLRIMTMDYLQGAYGNFYRSLQHICETYNINDGKLMTIPFSIGDTCFQDFCRFESTAARRFIERIMVERTYGSRDSKMDVLKN